MEQRQGPMENLVIGPDPQFWNGKRVLLTGHTGFKGSWLAIWLKRLGAELTGLALPPDTESNLFDKAYVSRDMDSRILDIRDAAAVTNLVRTVQPEIIFHLAAQPLVRLGYQHPQDTFSTNILGTVNILEAMRVAPGVRASVIVTTDKVYRNREWQYPYREDDELGGHDPYSASKAAAELVTMSYRDSFLRAQGLAVATARAGNVIGGGDWSADRLLPDAVRAWQSGMALAIRRPNAVRPWQHVVEPICAYLRLAQGLWEDPSLAGAYNFGPAPSATATVQQVAELAGNAYGLGKIVYESEEQGPHEAGLLCLETAKARQELNIHPHWSLQEAVTRTVHWYKRDELGEEAEILCLQDISDFEESR